MRKITKRLSALLLVLTMAGYSLFAADSAYTSSNDVKKAQVAMATNEYIVTAGDIYTLAFSNGDYSISVDSTYRVRIANLGIINAKGLTLQEFKNKVESLIINNYPTGGVQFFLANPAQFHVYVTGEVTASTTVDTWAMVRASDLLKGYYTNYSSKRFFKIVSAEGEEKEYDLYKASRNGDFFQDPYLRPGDTLIVPQYSRKVQVSGAVKRPGTYELSEGEQIQSLIKDYADGYTMYANKSDMTLRRFTGGTGIYAVSYLSEADYVADMVLFDDDRLSVGSIQDTRPVFYIEGAIAAGSLNGNESADAKTSAQNQGIEVGPAAITRLKMNYNDGESYSSFIRSNRNMLTNSSDLVKAYVLRRSEDGDDVETISIDLTKILYTTGYYDNLLIKPEDILVIPYIQYYVYVNGAVAAPGRYSYQPDRDWTYYVNLANGFNLSQNSFSTVKIRDKNGKRVSQKSTIPPEATITARRDKPDQSWIFALVTGIFTVIQTCFTIYLYMKVGGTNGVY